MNVTSSSITFQFWTSEVNKIHMYCVPVIQDKSLAIKSSELQLFVWKYKVKLEVNVFSSLKRIF